VASIGDIAKDTMDQQGDLIKQHEACIWAVDWLGTALLQAHSGFYE